MTYLVKSWGGNETIGSDDYNAAVKQIEDQISSESFFVRVIISLTTCLAIIALLLRNWLYTFWIDYKSSKQFYMRLMELQKNAKNNQGSEVHDEEKDESLSGQKFKKESHFWKFIELLISWEFFFEFSILIIHPPPGVEKLYTFMIINMLGNKNILVPVYYLLSDFLFALMFCRFYFLIRALLNFSIFSDLYSKRLCSKFGVEASVGFYCKALYVKKPGVIIILISSLSITWLSYVLRIFERYSILPTLPILLLECISRAKAR